MIKLLFYIETLSAGGAEKVLRNLVNAMDQSQFDITVQTTWREAQEQYLIPGIRDRYCFAKKNALTNFLYRAEAALGLLYPLHIRGNYDIEAAYLECAPTKILAGSTNRRAKKLAWVHCDLQKAMADPTAFTEKTRAWYRKFDRVICVSEHVRTSFHELFGSTVKTDILYNTVDHEEILEKAQLPLPDGIEKRKFTAVILGRLTPPKKISRLLRAHSRLMQEGFDYDLWIVGEGEERRMLEDYIAKHHLEDSAKLLGFHENPYPFLQAADLLVCSSVYEGFSTFITEGLILGRPIVTTDCSGMRELLGDSEYGLITENDDDAFYEGMKRMLSDEALRAHYTAQAEKRGRDFRRERLVLETEAYFEKLLLEREPQ